MEGALAQAADDLYKSDEFQLENLEPKAPVTESTGGARLTARGKKLSLSEKLSSAANELDQEKAEEAKRALKTIAREHEDFRNAENFDSMLNDAAEQAEKRIAKKEKEKENHGDDSSDDEGEDDSDLNDELFYATHKGDRQYVVKLIDRGANAKALDRDGWTPIHWAACKGYDDILRKLLDAVGPSAQRTKNVVNKSDNLTGWTPLHVAAIGGHLDCCRLLVLRGASVEKKNLMSETPGDCFPLGKVNRESRREVAALLGIRLPARPRRDRQGDNGETRGEGKDGEEEQEEEEEEDDEEDHYEDDYEEEKGGESKSDSANRRAHTYNTENEEAKS